MRLRSVLLILAVSFVMCRAAWPEVHYSSEGARDPFFERAAEPLAVTAPGEGSAESLVLGGILWSPGGGRAQINGQSVKAGDLIGNVEIVAIEKKSIKLKRNGKEGTLTKQGIQWT